MSLREKVAAIVGALGLEPKMSSGGRGGAEILNGYGREVEIRNSYSNVTSVT